MKKVIYSLALVLMLTITALCVTACGGGGAIKLNKTSTTLVEGQSETLVATLEGVEGTVVWQSDEPSVAMVNGYGLVTAIKEGTANITAKVGGETATCVVTVVLEKSVTLDKDTVSVSLFEDVKLNASVKNLTGSVIWSSSDESVATVTNNGLVVAKKAGTVTITATVDGKSDSCQIEFNAVDANDVLAIENEIDTYSLYTDAQAKIQPYVVMNNQTEINGAEYTFVSSDPAIAQVLDDGTIQPVSFGQTTITISGTVKGVQLVSKQVTVIIKEKLIVSTGYTGENLLLYLTEGSTNNPVSYTINASATIDGQNATGGEFTYTTEDSDIITLNSNVITAKSTGIAKVTVTYTLSNGTTASEDISVLVEKSVITLTDKLTFNNFNANDISSISLNGELKAITINGQTVLFALDQGKVIFTNNDATTGENVDVILETELEKYSVKANVYDFVVSNKEEFMQAFNHASEGKSSDQNQAANYTYIVLTDNIDLGGDYIPNGWYYFSGTIDGNGYTVNNVFAHAGLFLGLYNATIKDIGFTNVFLNNNAAGTIASAITGNSVIENVFVHAYTNSSTQSGNVVGVGNWIQAGSIVKDSIVIVDALSMVGSGNSIYAYGDAVTDAENSYFVVLGANAYSNGVETGAGMYTSIEEFKADSQDIKATLSSDVWTLENGMLIFKSVKEFNQVVTELAITNTETNILSGSSLNITTSIEGATISLKQSVEGVTLKGNVLSVSKDIDESVSITVVATYENIVLGTKLTTEKQIEVLTAQVIDESKVQIIAKDKTVDFSYDISSYEIAELESVTFNGVSIAHSYQDGVVTIARSAFASIESIVTITAKQGNTYYVFNVPVKAPDYTIETAQDFSSKGFADNNQTAYYLMLDNVDCNNTVAISWSGLTFKGTLDGNGYTLTKPYNVGQGAFYVLDGATVKNISIVGINLVAYGGLLATEIKGNTVIENVYIEGKTSADSSISDDWAFFGGLAYSVSETTTVNNVVVVADASARGTTQTAYPVLGRWNRTDTQGISNVYYICAQGTTIANGVANPVNTGVYGSQADFDTAVANQTVKLDSPYWQIVDGTYVIKPVK